MKKSRRKKTFLHRNVFNVFTYGTLLQQHYSICTQTPVHTNALTPMFTRTRFYTQTLLQTNTFTQSFYTHFYTQTLSHTTTSTLEPCTRTLLRSKALPPDQPNSQKKTQFLTLKPYFVRKGCRRKNQTRKKTSVSDTRTSFHAKRLSLDQPNSQKNNRF